MNDDVLAFAEGYALNFSYCLAGFKYGLFVVYFLSLLFCKAPSVIATTSLHTSLPPRDLTLQPLQHLAF